MPTTTSNGWLSCGLWLACSRRPACFLSPRCAAPFRLHSLSKIARGPVEMTTRYGREGMHLCSLHTCTPAVRMRVSPARRTRQHVSGTRQGPSHRSFSSHDHQAHQSLGSQGGRACVFDDCPSHHLPVFRQGLRAGATILFRAPCNYALLRSLSIPHPETLISDFTY